MPARRARPQRPPLPLGRRLAFIAITLLGLLGLAEAASWVVVRHVATRVFYGRHVPYDHAEDQAKRDPVVGWPHPEWFNSEQWDEVGARPSPGFPDRAATPPGIAFYGDSFTYSDEVDDEHAWPETIARRIGRRVDNFGVGGYGAGQSLLRFLHNGDVDTAPVVVLCHSTVDVLRQLTQNFRHVHGDAADESLLTFKPRYVLDERGELELVPLPTVAPEDYERFADDPGSFLPHDLLAPGRMLGQVPGRFPFTLAVARAVVDFDSWCRLVLGGPAYWHAYRHDHPSRGAELTAAIIERFWRTAIERGRHPAVVIIPTDWDLARLAEDGVLLHRALNDGLERRGIPFVDATPEIVERFGGLPPDSFYAGGWRWGHFSEEGYAVLADIVFAHLVERGLIGDVAGPGG
jgi:hypothetical protein